VTLKSGQQNASPVDSKSPMYSFELRTPLRSKTRLRPDSSDPVRQRGVQGQVLAITPQNKIKIKFYSLPLAISTARSTARALFSVSSNSRCGSESATIPAPACKYAFLPFMSRVRIAMHESRLPAKSA